MKCSHIILSSLGLCSAVYVDSKGLQDCITQEGLHTHLAALDRIASENGGNRAFGYPGFEASSEYVHGILSKSDKFHSWIQTFPANYSEVKSITFSVGDEEFYVFGLTYSPSTSEEGLTAPLVLGPEAEAACDVASYDGLDVTDKLVLVERGTCPTGGTLAGKIVPAVAAGAAGVIVYNNVETKVTGGTLSNPDPERYRPSGFINQVDGLALKERLEGGEELEAYFQQTQDIEVRETTNIITETKSGSADHVLMLGAHLDSVPAGAGINDDGSGTTLLLEIFAGLQKFETKNMVRLAFWGAEEIGLVGSKYYTSTLSEEDTGKLMAYLNFDMVSRGYWGVFDGDGSTHGLAGPAGSDVIEGLFVDYLVEKGLNVTPAVFTGGSDYRYYMETLDKPVGGLHTGTGVAQDDCYHQECDKLQNANITQLETNTKAAAHVLSILAMEGDTLIPRSSSGDGAIAARRRNLAGMTSSELFPWSVVEGERHLATCGHDD